MVWLVEIGGAAAVSIAAPAPWQPGATIPGLSSVLNTAAVATPVYRFSDRGWIGEPGDAARSNIYYAPRLAAAIAIEESFNPLPEGPRRTITAGEIVLHNADGAMAGLGGRWEIFGRPVAIYRLPYQAPFRVAFSTGTQIASFRTVGVPYGTDTLRFAIGGAQLDLGMPACAVYGGTGGLDGNSTLVGKYKPRALGTVLNTQPVMLDFGLQIYQVHDGEIAGISELRDKGIALIYGGNFATYAAMIAAAAPPAGYWYSCIAVGVVRLGASPSGTITVDCSGDSATATGGYSNSLPGMARKVIEGLGAVGAAGWISPGFATWPAGPAGLVLRGGTVADALDRLARAGCGWWGADTQGRLIAGIVTDPASTAAVGTLRLLAEKPTQALPTAPRWRARAAYDVLDLVQPPADLAAGVTGTARDRLGEQARYATTFDGAILAAIPGATDPDPIPSLFTTQSDALGAANAQLNLHRVGRATWSVKLGRFEPTLALGQVWRVASGLAPMLAERNYLVVGRSIRGDEMSVTLWG